MPDIPNYNDGNWISSPENIPPATFNELLVESLNTAPDPDYDYDSGLDDISDHSEHENEAGLAPDSGPIRNSYGTYHSMQPLETVSIGGQARTPLNYNTTIKGIIKAPKSEHFVIQNHNDELFILNLNSQNSFVKARKLKFNPDDNEFIVDDSILTKCSDCGRDIKSNNKLRQNYFILNDKSYVCEECVKNLIPCADCGCLSRKQNLYFDVCKVCVENAPNRLIQQYSTKAERQFEKRGNPQDEIFYGVEVEYESKNYGLDTLIVHSLIKEFAVLKRDSSINKGFEIVSGPNSMDVHYELWKDFFDKVPDTVVPEDTCGMHVHFSRVYLGDVQIWKMFQFIYNQNNRQVIEVIAGRASNHHNNFHEARPIKEARDGGFYSRRDRHHAVNLNNENTVEIRLFASTKNKVIFFKNIEFVKALVKFTHPSVAGLKECESAECFYRFVMGARKEYPNLALFMKENEIFQKFARR